MVNFSFWDGFGSSRPKSDAKEYREQIRFYVKTYVMNYGRTRSVSTGEIANYMLNTQKGYDFKDNILWRWLGLNYGLRGEISSATHYWRSVGKPIISGGAKKGYRWADETCSNLAEVWEDGFRGHSKREKNWEKEKITMTTMLKEVIKKVKSKKEKEKLKKLLVQYA